MSHTILILEDDVHIAKEIATRIHLARFGTAIVTHTEAECLEAIRQYDFDMAILDIELPGKPTAGFKIAQQLDGVPFIFLSGHSQKRYAAYDLNPRAFWRKPFDEKTMDFIELTLAKRPDFVPPPKKNSGPIFNENDMFVPHQGAHHHVDVKDILFVRLEDGCLSIQLEKETYLMWVTIDFFLSQFKSEAFLRIHRSHAINLAHLKRFSAGEVQVGKFTLPASKSGIQLVHRAVRKIQSKRKDKDEGAN